MQSIGYVQNIPSHLIPFYLLFSYSTRPLLLWDIEEYNRKVSKYLSSRMSRWDMAWLPLLYCCCCWQLLLLLFSIICEKSGIYAKYSCLYFPHCSWISHLLLIIRYWRRQKLGGVLHHLAALLLEGGLDTVYVIIFKHDSLKKPL